MTPKEIETIKAIAWRELTGAYAEFRIAFTDAPGPSFHVRVIQGDLTFGATGESRTLGLGGDGVVSFPAVAANAIFYAPAAAQRATIIEGIGRGIGRAAVHELAHQLVPRINIHRSRDPNSYEYGSGQRYSEYYGTLHWDIARGELLRSLGASSPSAAQP
jgi:hypothetical protein